MFLLYSLVIVVWESYKVFNLKWYLMWVWLLVLVNRINFFWGVWGILFVIYLIFLVMFDIIF